MSDEQLIVAVNPGYLPVRCKVCNYSWEKPQDVPARDFEMCPEVFFLEHKGGHPAPVVEARAVEDDEPEIDAAPVTSTTEKITYEDLTIRQELTAEDLQTMLTYSEFVDNDILGVSMDPDPPVGPDSVVAFKLTMRVPTFHCIICDRVVERGVNNCSAHRGVIQVLKKEPV